MIIKKILETYIDISDPKDIFSPNRDEMILKKLTDKFVGVCYMSCFILKINRLIRRSYIYMKDTLDGDTFTSIMFEVDAIIYSANEIINGCKIIKKEPNGIIHAKSEFAGIQLSVQPSMAIFKEGEVVPVIVKRVRYNVNQTAISVLAIPFMPISRETIYYDIYGELTKQQTDDIKLLIQSIKNEEMKISSIKASDRKIYDFFAELLSTDDKNFPQYKKTHISKILDINPSIIFRNHAKYNDDNIYYDSQDKSKDFQSELSAILGESNSDQKDTQKDTQKNHQKDTQKNHQKDTQKNPQKNIINETKYIAFSSILSGYLMNLQTLLNFVEHYPTFDDVQVYKHIWKMYSAMKK